METKIDEIAPDVFRLSTIVPDAAPGGFGFNQFLVRDEQPFLVPPGVRRVGIAQLGHPHARGPQFFADEPRRHLVTARQAGPGCARS